MPRRYLWVGDPHAEPHDLDDAQALLDRVFAVATQNRVDAVVLAGDLYDTHAIIHAEVQLLWWDFFKRCKDKGLEVVVLKGNHDAPGTRGTRATALLAHLQQCTAVLYEPHEEQGVVFCPYVHDGEELVRWSQQYAGAKTMFCHQTFNGSSYENGFYAGDGIDPEKMAQQLIISGHIHTPQEFTTGRVTVRYPGAPRWRHEVDAKVQERAIWLYEFQWGKLILASPFRTGDTCRRIIREVDHPDHPLDTNKRPQAKDDYRVTIEGPQSWIDARVPLFEGWAKVRSRRTDELYAPAVRESDGPKVAFSKYLKTVKPRYGTEPEIIESMVAVKGVFG